MLKRGLETWSPQFPPQNKTKGFAGQKAYMKPECLKRDTSTKGLEYYQKKKKETKGLEITQNIPLIALRHILKTFFFFAEWHILKT